MNTPTYDKKWFISKFSATSEEAWCTGAFTHGECCCALGFCGELSLPLKYPEGRALARLFGNFDGRRIAAINDGDDPAYPQKTPRARVLAALHDLP